MCLYQPAAHVVLTLLHTCRPAGEQYDSIYKTAKAHNLRPCQGHDVIQAGLRHFCEYSTAHNLPAATTL